MKVLKDVRVIELTRRNLEMLLSKLDGNPRNSSRAIMREGWMIRAVEDEKHYGDRPAGQMIRDTERAVSKRRQFTADFAAAAESKGWVGWHTKGGEVYTLVQLQGPMTDDQLVKLVLGRSFRRLKGEVVYTVEHYEYKNFGQWQGYTCTCNTLSGLRTLSLHTLVNETRLVTDAL